MQSAIMNLLRNDVSISLRTTKTPKSSFAAGWFGTTPKELHVFMGDDYGFETFVHEYNHFVQTVEDPYLWERCRHSLTKFFAFCSGAKIKKVDFHCHAVIDLEHDCESRSLQMARALSLPIQRRDYARQANSYLYSIILSRHFGTWAAKLPPATLTAKLPSKLLSSAHFKDINNVPQELFKFYEKQFKDKELQGL